MPNLRIPILGHGTMPDSSARVFMQPFSIAATNDLWGHQLIFVFQDTATRIGLQGRFEVPKNYFGSPAIIAVWTSVAITNDVVWDFDYDAVGGDDLESLDQATPPQESVTVTDTAPSAALERMEASMPLTAGNLAVDDTVLFELFRDGTALDTIVGNVLLFGLLFQYADA